MKKENKILIASLLIVLGVVCRLLPHPWNFAPISAIALFSGVYLGYRYAVLVPLAAMLIGDIFIGFYGWQLMLAVYLSYLLVGLLGGAIKNFKSFETVAAGSLAASILFFSITNYAVWQFSPWYAKSLSGLLECYYLALPFFRNTLLSDLFYTAVFFGAYEAVCYFVGRKKLAYKY